MTVHLCRQDFEPHIYSVSTQVLKTQHGNFYQWDVLTLFLKTELDRNAFILSHCLYKQLTD